MSDIIANTKRSLKNASLIDILFLTTLILSLSSLVLTRSYNYLLILICGGTGLYKLLSGYRIKVDDIALIFSILGGAYISYRSSSLGPKSILLGLLVGGILITTYKAVKNEK